MNLESQIVIFSCNQRTVKKTVLPISGGKKFMAKCKRNCNRAKRNFTFKTPAANRNYKDTVFRMLFSDRKICSLFTMPSIRENPCTKFYRVLQWFDGNCWLYRASAFLSIWTSVRWTKTWIDCHGFNVQWGAQCRVNAALQYIKRICTICCQSAALCSGYVFRSGRGTCRRRVYQGRDFSRISYPQPKWGHQYEYLWVW